MTTSRETPKPQQPHPQGPVGPLWCVWRRYGPQSCRLWPMWPVLLCVINLELSRGHVTRGCDTLACKGSSLVTGRARRSMPFRIVSASRRCVFAHRSIGLTSMFETTTRVLTMRPGVMVRQALHGVENWGQGANLLRTRPAAPAGIMRPPMRHPGARRRLLHRRHASGGRSYGARVGRARRGGKFARLIESRGKSTCIPCL